LDDRERRQINTSNWLAITSNNGFRVLRGYLNSSLDLDSALTFSDNLGHELGNFSQLFRGSGL